MSHALLRVLATLGWGNLPVARLYEGHVNALLLITTFGSADQRMQAAEDASRGEVFAVWNTEAGDGVRLESTGAGRHRLLGAKTFASGADAVTRPVVTGRLPDGGWQMMLLPLGDADRDRVDTSWWRPLGMNASASHRIDFGDLEVAGERAVGLDGSPGGADVGDDLTAHRRIGNRGAPGGGTLNVTGGPDHGQGGGCFEALGAVGQLVDPGGGFLRIALAPDARDDTGEADGLLGSHGLACFAGHSLFHISGGLLGILLGPAGDGGSLGRTACLGVGEG